jgi:uncharacterized protein involved in exopolysaccharide biosynthesis
LSSATGCQSMDERLFRREAFEHHFREQESRGVLDTSARCSWLGWAVSLALVVGALTYAQFARVEVAYRADAVVRLDGLSPVSNDEWLASIYVPGNGTINLPPGTRVRLETLRATAGRLPFIDGRLLAIARTPSAVRLQIVLSASDFALLTGATTATASIPVRIHAPLYEQSLLRYAVSTLVR